MQPRLSQKKRTKRHVDKEKMNKVQFILKMKRGGKGREGEGRRDILSMLKML